MSSIKDDVRETVQNYLWVIQQVYNQQEALTEIKNMLVSLVSRGSSGLI